MARTRWPPDLWNPGLWSRPGRSGRHRWRVPEKTWGPAGRSIRRTARTGVSRFAGQAGTQAPDPTPLLSRDRGSRAGSTTHTLPADYERSGWMIAWWRRAHL